MVFTAATALPSIQLIKRVLDEFKVMIDLEANEQKK
jgi:hypothetical protein